MLRDLKNTWRVARRDGPNVAFRRALRRLKIYREAAAYRKWVDAYDTVSEDDRREIRGRIDRLRLTPTISVLMPVYNVPEKWLRPAIESVVGQLYPHWELCLADDHSEAPHVRKVLDEYAA